jgi:hypothetical protein
MAKPAIESPEPAVRPLASADDLLSQMAGEEIDRLLAEADVEVAKSAARNTPLSNGTTTDSPAPTFASSIPTVLDPRPTNAPNSKSSESNVPASETLASAHDARASGISADAGSAGVDIAASLEPDLDELFAELTQNDPPSSAVGPAEAASAVSRSAEPSSAVEPTAGLSDADLKVALNAVVDESKAVPSAGDGSIRGESGELAGRESTVDATVEPSPVANAVGHVSDDPSAADAHRGDSPAAESHAGDNDANMHGGADMRDPGDLHDPEAHRVAQLLNEHADNPGHPAIVNAAMHGVDGSLEALNADAPAGGRKFSPDLSVVFSVLYTVLEWINAPMDAYPDSLREGLGWIGVVTFLNAIAVLIYVMLFKRH